MLINANALHIPLKDKSIQCCVTSPPYWGLRDYGTAEWVGGNDDCEHTISMPKKWNDPKRGTDYTRPEVANRGGDSSKCFLCGAIRIDNQLGLEQTPEEYVENMVAVFREVWRVLRDDGTLWLNLGDSYATSHSPGTTDDKKGWKHGDISQGYQGRTGGAGIGVLKAKDLVGIPWRVAFALQADGWYLRNDIIWHKPNPMPESVRDRCTKSHEYIFLLTKNAKCYYDNEAIKEGASTPIEDSRNKRTKHNGEDAVDTKIRGANTQCGTPVPGKRNKRTVWTITTKPYKGAHYATFPPELPEVCIKAGTSERGSCPGCGSPWVRITKEVQFPRHETEPVDLATDGDGSNRGKHARPTEVETTGWQPQCDCGKDPVPCIVLDPFVGSGTTCLVARDLGRESVGLDLSFDYLVNNARVRLELDKLEYWYSKGPEVEGNFEGLPMFTD